jgi:hypothetical protein
MQAKTLNGALGLLQEIAVNKTCETAPQRLLEPPMDDEQNWL